MPLPGIFTNLDVKQKSMSNSTYIEEAPKNYWHERYNELLEKHNALLKRMADVKIDADVEINLGNEVENFCLEYDARKDAWYNMTPRDQKLLSNPTWLNFATNIARHFYGLGLNARIWK